MFTAPIIITNVEKLRIKRMDEISKYFSRKEFACRCNCGFATVDVELIEVLQTLRYKFNKPVTITSGCRCPEYNEKIGGSYGSKHKQGIAADIVVEMVSAADVYRYLDSAYPHKFGLGRYDEFTHIDVRPKKARWRG